LEKSNLLAKRTVFIFTLIVIGLLSIFYLPQWCFTLFVIFFITGGLKEFFDMALKVNIPVYKKLGIFTGLLIVFAVSIKFHPTEEWTLFFILLSFIIFFALQFNKKEHHNVITGISTTFFAIIYVSWLGSYVIKLKMLPEGQWLVLFLLLTTKSVDVGGYIIGRFMGKHKLLAKVSPKKSIEGAIGGFLACVLVSVLSKLYLAEVSIYHLIILGLLIGLSSQLGDLTESLIKRDCEVKDSGRFIPEQGGILDLIDSVLFSAPVVYLYVVVYNLQAAV
jgi:phosphatidate cytidylyltransferase